MASKICSILSWKGEILLLKIDIWEHIAHLAVNLFRCWWLNCYESGFVCWFIVLFCWDEKHFFSSFVNCIDSSSELCQLRGRNTVKHGEEKITKLIRESRNVRIIKKQMCYMRYEGFERKVHKKSCDGLWIFNPLDFKEIFRGVQSEEK